MRNVLGLSSLGVLLAIAVVACGDSGGGSQTGGTSGDPNGSAGGGAGGGTNGGAPGGATDGGSLGTGSKDAGGSATNGDAGAPKPGSDSGAPGPTSCGGGGGASGGPGDLFPCDSTWRKDVSQLPVASESSGIIGGIGAWGAGGRFLIDFSILFMHDDGTAPTKTFAVDYADESQHDPVPIVAGGAIEGETGYNCVSGGDCHLIVVQDSTHRLFELYSASNGGGSTWAAAQESVWDLTKHYGPAGRGLGCTSADAAGLSVMAGLIGVRETKAGKIDHAIRFILPNSKIRRGPSYIAPATHGTSATTSSSGPPYGTRLRLKASFNESAVASAGGKAIVRALKTYGMILADGGEYALTAEDDRFEKAKDPAMAWSGILSDADIHFITPQDFEVVDFAPVQTGSNCTLL
jgi:hypothetical protein